MATEYLFLQGDSYPADEHVRQALQSHLGCSLIMIEPDKPAAIARRLDRLKAYFTFRPSCRFVLIGRSSGSLVATLAAADPWFAARIKAVICASYPFRHPARPVEPERFTHLPAVLSPCLMIQARRDEYGGENEIGGYPLSTTTRVHFVDGHHELRLPPSSMLAISQAIRRFLHEQDATSDNDAFPDRDAIYWPHVARRLNHQG